MKRSASQRDASLCPRLAPPRQARGPCPLACGGSQFKSLLAMKMSKKSDDKIEYISEDDTGAVDKKIKKIKDKLKKCQKEKEEYLAGWQRAKADLINYKKEQEKKASDYYKFANEGLISEILLALDSFEEAMKHTKDEGIQQLYNQLLNILKNQGLEEIKTVGEKFNPEFHESVGEVKSKEKQGIVAEEVQRGYTLHGKTIRAARVKVVK